MIKPAFCRGLRAGVAVAARLEAAPRLEGACLETVPEVVRVLADLARLAERVGRRRGAPEFVASLSEGLMRSAYGDFSRVIWAFGLQKAGLVNRSCVH